MAFVLLHAHTPLSAIILDFIHFYHQFVGHSIVTCTHKLGVRRIIFRFSFVALFFIHYFCSFINILRNYFVFFQLVETQF